MTRRNLAAGFTLAFLLAACRDAERSAPVQRNSTSTQPTVSGPQDGGTIVRRLESDVNTLNALLTSTFNESDVLSYLHVPIVEYGKDLEILPGLAREWEVSSDGRTYTFRLDPAATFSDGTPVRASDAIFTLKKIVDPATESGRFAGQFEGLDTTATRVIDDRSFQVVFGRPRAGQLAAFNLPILPEHVYGKGNFQNDFNSTVVGSGPYRLVSREPGKQIILERREDFNGRRPPLKKIVFKVLEDPAVAWRAMKAGDLDEMRLTADMWKLDRDRPEVRDKINFLRYYFLSYNFIAWNNRHPQLADREVRRALSMCLDRPSIIFNISHGTSRIITGPFTPEQWAYNVAVPAIRYDPAGARRILEAKGWRDTDGDGLLDREGKPFQVEMLLSSRNKGNADVMQVFQSGLAKAGVKMIIARVDGASLFARVLKGDYQSTYLGWDIEPDPDVYTVFHSSQTPPNGQNIVFYSNPEADKLIVAGREELNRNARAPIYRKLHELLANDQPYTFVSQPEVIWAVNRRVREVQVSNGLGLFSWAPGPRSWWIPESERRGEVSAPPAAR